MKRDEEFLAAFKLKEVRVYVWHSKLDEDRVGHIAVEFDYPKPCYISLWPKDEKWYSTLIPIEPSLMTSYEQDIMNEEGEATHIFKFYTLKNDEMFKRFKEINVPNWVLLPGVFNRAHNCSSLVLYILKVGGLEDLVTRGQRYLLKIQDAVKATGAITSSSSNLAVNVVSSKEIKQGSRQSIQASFESAEAFASVLFTSPDSIISLLTAAEKVEDEKNSRIKRLKDGSVDITNALQILKNSLATEELQNLKEDHAASENNVANNNYSLNEQGRPSSEVIIINKEVSLPNSNSELVSNQSNALPLSMHKGLILLTLANKLTNLVAPQFSQEFNEIKQELEKSLYEKTTFFLKEELAKLDKKFINRHQSGSLIFNPMLQLIENLNGIDVLYQENINNARAILIENVKNNPLAQMHQETIQYELNLLERRYLDFEFPCSQIRTLLDFLKQHEHFRFLFLLYSALNELFEINATSKKHEFISSDTKFYDWSLTYINKTYGGYEANYITNLVLNVTQHLGDMRALFDFSLTELFTVVSNQAELTSFIVQKIRPSLTKILQATSRVTLHYEVLNNLLMAMQNNIEKAYFSEFEAFRKQLTYQFTRPNRLLNIWIEICKYLHRIEEQNQQTPFFLEDKLREFEQFYQIHDEIQQRNQLTNATQRMYDFKLQIAKHLDKATAGLSLNFNKKPLYAIKAIKEIFDKRLLGAEQNNDQVNNYLAIIMEIRVVLKNYSFDDIDKVTDEKTKNQINNNPSFSLIKQILSNYQEAADKQLQSQVVSAPLTLAM